MRIILKQDVKDLGRSGDVVTVAEGYGRNYLLPRKLAVQATPGNLTDWNKRIQAAQEREQKERQEAQGLVERLREARITLTGKAAEGTTRIHGSITAADIAGKINATLAPPTPIDRRDIELKEPIRSLGEHVVKIRLGKGIAAPVTVVVAEEGAVQAAPAE
jgi:large subunit ribosomal protein L9